ncbi:DNA double-strand break repair nuclease NurA [Sulfurihydrogenibium subterraneum]|uniref:DNA double-strand break repair nuclease NurA n=1 Tax=Sulfurihydrogenibium subterraneum TaxID=171121 RepID=UPI000490A808|nr:DNA double-strand break repair nuclease NurA [Sulfurihydrogenibium subterraneum]
MVYRLLEVIRQKKSYILKYLENKDLDISLQEILEKWNSYSPAGKDIHIAASDGSFYSKQYLGFFLGVFSGYAESFDPKTQEADSDFVGDVYLSVIKQSDNFKTLLTLFMFLSEVKAVYNLAKRKKPDFIMLDGTITSKFIIPFPLPYWFTKEESEDLLSLIKQLYPKVKDNCLSYPYIYSLSQEIEKEVLSNLSDKRRDLLEVVISQLAYYEHLITLYNLLNLEYKPIIIGLAKTSTGTDLLKSSVPDIKLFLEYCKDLGYSQPVYQNLQSLKSEFGQLQYVDLDLNNKLYDLTIESFYAKYSDVRSINLIEYFQHPDRASVKEEEILDYLRNTTSVYNYPLRLKMVDKQVRITAADFELIERELGLSFSITGREAL